ncbi:MAG: YSIRK-type signal peptide-containing protein, partial [Bifidobacteriaceae bacterium]|nr:YSIRK-type signal peptide-containing protein [Bifidobacteriaceae bacterium]
MRGKQNPFEEKRRPHFGLRKLSVGVCSVLLSTTIFFGSQIAETHASTQTTSNNETGGDDTNNLISQPSVALQSANDADKNANVSTNQTTTATTNDEASTNNVVANNDASSTNDAVSTSSSVSSDVSATDLTANSDTVTLNNSDINDRNINISVPAKKGQKVTVTVPYIFSATSDNSAGYTYNTDNNNVNADFNTTTQYKNTVFNYTMNADMSTNWNIALKKAIDNWSLLPAGKEFDIVIAVDGVEKKRIKYTIGTINQITSADVMFDQNQKTNLVKNQKYIAGVKLGVNDPTGDATGSFEGTITVHVPKGFLLDSGQDTQGPVSQNTYEYAYGFIPGVDKLGDTFDKFNTLATGQVTMTQASAGSDIVIKFSGLSRSDIANGIFSFWGKYTDDVTAGDNNFTAAVQYINNDPAGETSTATYTTNGSESKVGLATATTENAHLQADFNKLSDVIYTDNGTTSAHQRNSGQYQYVNQANAYDTVTVYNNGNVDQKNVKVAIDVEPGTVLTNTGGGEDYWIRWSTTTQNQPTRSDEYPASFYIVLTDGTKVNINSNRTYYSVNRNNPGVRITSDLMDKGVAQDGSNIKQIVWIFNSIKAGTKIDFNFSSYSILSRATSKKTGDFANYSYTITSDNGGTLTGQESLKIVDPVLATRRFNGSTVFNSGTYQPTSDQLADFTWKIFSDNYTPNKSESSSYLLAVPKGFKVQGDLTIVGADGKPVSGATLTPLGNIGLNGETMYRLDLTFVPGRYGNTNDGQVHVKAKLVGDLAATGSKYYYGWNSVYSYPQYAGYENLAQYQGKGMSLLMAINDNDIYSPSQGNVSQETEGTSITLLDGNTYKVVKQDLFFSNNNDPVKYPNDLVFRAAPALYNFIYPSMFGSIDSINTDDQKGYSDRANLKYSEQPDIQSQLGKTTGTFKITNIISQNGDSNYSYNYIPIDNDHVQLTGAGTITASGNAKSGDGSLYYYFGDNSKVTIDDTWDGDTDLTSKGFISADDAAKKYGNNWYTKVTGVILKGNKMTYTSAIDAVVPYKIVNITGEGSQIVLTTQFVGDHNGSKYESSSNLTIDVARYVRQTVNDYTATVDGNGHLVINASPDKTTSKVVKVGSNLTYDRTSDADLNAAGAIYQGTYAYGSSQDQASSVSPFVPEMVSVNDSNNLTYEEKQAVKSAIVNTNSGVLPQGTDVFVDNNGDTYLTFPDGSRESIPGYQLVSGKTSGTGTTTGAPKSSVSDFSFKKVTDSSKALSANYTVDNIYYKWVNYDTDKTDYTCTIKFVDTDGSAVDGVNDIVQTTSGQKHYRLDPFAKYLSTNDDTKAVKSLLDNKSLDIKYDAAKPFETANVLGYYNASNGFVSETDPTKAVTVYTNEASSVQFANTDQAKLLASKGFNTSGDPTVKVAASGHSYSQAAASNITGVSGFNPDKPDTNVYFVSWPHDTITVTAADPKTTSDQYTQPDGTTMQNYPEGVTSDDLNKTITRTIVVTTPDGQKTNEEQTVKYQRSKTIDKVTNKVISTSDWTVNGTDTWPAYDASNIPGYKINVDGQDVTGSHTVPAYKTSSTDSDTTVNVTYVPLPQTITYQAIDKDDNNSAIDLSGLGVKTSATGNTDSATTATTDVDAIKNALAAKGYDFDSNDALPAKYVAGGQTVKIYFTHHKITVDPSQPKTTNDQYTQPDGNTKKNYPSGVANSDLNKTITRTINVNKPGQEPEVVSQAVSFERTATVDQVTNAVSYGEWSRKANSAENWPAYDADAVDGYKINVDGKDVTADHTVAAFTPSASDSDTTVNVAYVPLPQTNTYQAIDKENGNSTISLSGLGVKTTATGNTGSDTTAVADVEAIKNALAAKGYDFDSNDTLPNKYVAGGQTIKIYFTHHKITVDPSQPKTTDDQYTQPDGKTKTNYPSGVDEASLNKTVTRTIIVNDPHSGAQTTKQDVNFQRSATVDQVTNGVTYSNWTVKSGSKTSWDAFTSPEVAGYTVSPATVDEKTPTAESQNETVNVNYTAQAQKITLEAYDKSDNGSKIDLTGVTTVVDGKTDENVDLSGNVTAIKNALAAKGYVFDSSDEIPTKFGSSDQTVKLYFTHQTINVTHDDPKKPSETYKQPDGKTDKNYPSGVDESDLNKTVTRTITVTNPDGTKKVTTQDVKFVRDATVDQVSGDVKYTEWKVADNTPSQWPEFTTPVLPGYTASQDNVEATTPSVDTTDPDIQISYSAHNQKATITYYDDSTNQVLSVEPYNGDSAKTVNTKVSDTVADYQKQGYALVTPEASLPTTITFDTDDNEDQSFEVHFNHSKLTVGPSDPKKPSQTYTQPDGKTEKNYPSGVDETDLNKTVTRTITVTNPQGVSTKETQTVSFERNATIDQVNNTVTYGEWKLKEGSASTWPAFSNVPAIDGYKATQTSVDEKTPSADTPDENITITYVAQAQSITIESYDETNNDQKIDLDGATQTLNGKTDESVDVNSNIDAIKAAMAAKGYQYNAARTTELPTKYTAGAQTVKLYFTHGKITVTPDQPKTTGETYKQPDGKTDQNYPSGVDKASLNKTVTRTITVNKPGQQSEVHTQEVSFERTATIDQVNNKVEYGQWNKKTDSVATWPSFNAPEVSGYTADTATVAEVTPDANTADSHVYINYTAQTQTISFKAIDKDNGNKEIQLSGFAGLTTSVEGKTDEAANLDSYAKAIKDALAAKGYEFDENDSTPLPAKFVAGGQTVDLYFIHKKISVLHTDPKTEEQTYTQPDGKTTQNYPQGVADSDLNHTATRTITVNNPDKTSKITTQKVSFVRDATVDQVTNDVTYTDWKVDTGSASKWDSFTTPTLPGYTATLDSVDEVTPTATTSDSNIAISYTAHKQKANVTYWDDTDGVELATDPFVGDSASSVETGAQAKVAGYQKQGYKLVTEADQIPNTITFDTNDSADQDYTIHFVHGTITVNPSDPKTTDDKYKQPDGETDQNYPSGVNENDLNKTVTRTINIHVPKGAVQTVKQTVSFERTATIDQVTNNVEYSDWTVKSGSASSWPRYNAIPTVTGYQANRVFVNASAVTPDTNDTTVDITYTPRVTTMSLNAADTDTGTTLAWPDGVNQVLNGVTDGTISGLSDVLDQLKDKFGSQGYVYDADSTGNLPTIYPAGASTFTFYFKHGTLTVTSDQPKTTQETYKQPDGKTDKNYPSGVDSNSLVKNVVRTIYVHDPHNGVKTTVQTVTFVRNATIDQVTDQVTYTPWKLKSDSATRWPAFSDVPTIAGYKASQTTVA